MKTLMIGKQKGGVGASTIVRELAVSAAHDGLQVALIDLDPQHTTAAWWNRRTKGETAPNPNLADIAPAAVPGLIDRLKESHDLLIIDTPPSVHNFVAGLMRRADGILVPCRPSTDDLDALPAVLALIEAAGQGHAWAFTVTQSPAGRSRLYDDALAALARRGRVGPPLRMRADFPTAAAIGRTSTEIAPGRPAAAEVWQLWDYVSGDLLKMPHHERHLRPGEAIADAQAASQLSDEFQDDIKAAHKRPRTTGGHDDGPNIVVLRQPKGRSK